MPVLELPHSKGGEMSYGIFAPFRGFGLPAVWAAEATTAFVPVLILKSLPILRLVPTANDPICYSLCSSSISLPNHFPR
jgi:hypothetical protein